MLFQSTAFIVFLLGVLILYYVIPKNRWRVLLAASLVFYGFAGLSYLIYIGATILSVYGITMRMRQLRLARDAALPTLDKESRRECKAQTKAACWKWLLLSLFINFGVLAVVKYTDFAIANVNALLRLFNPGGSGAQLSFMRFLMPLGISFYTFQTMGYVIDVYREKTQPETNLFKMALFVSFFPQIIQGPISRFNDLSKTLFEDRPFDMGTVSLGMQRVLWGFFKKLVIADRLFPAVQSLVTQPDQYQGGYVLFGIFLYAITLFCDFTGGIDITIGVSEMFGIKVAENFDRPFYSRSIVEYWRRWHITMGTWFKDYLFYPLSVCKPMLRLSKASRIKLGDNIGKRVPVYISTLSVWFMTGLWHGATWNFIAWGLTNGFVILLSQELQPLYDRFHAKFSWGQTKGYGVFQVVRTFWLMGAIRSFDCYDGVQTTLKMILSIVTNFSFKQWVNEGVSGLGLTASGYISAGLGLAVVLLVSFLQRNGTDVRDLLARQKWPVRYAVVSAVFFMILIFGAYGIGYDAQQFIYNRF